MPGASTSTGTSPRLARPGPPLRRLPLGRPPALRARVAPGGPAHQAAASRRDDLVPPGALAGRRLERCGPARRAPLRPPDGAPRQAGRARLPPRHRDAVAEPHPAGHQRLRGRARGGALSPAPPAATRGRSARSRPARASLRRDGAPGDWTHRPRAGAGGGRRGGRRGGLPPPGRAAPRRAPRALLPDARVGPRRRGRPPGRAAACLAGVAGLPGAQLAARVALPDRHQRVPGHHRAPPQARPAARPRDGGRSAGGAGAPLVEAVWWSRTPTS